MIWYFVIQKPIGAISRNIKIYHFFLLLLVSDHFKHIVPFCVCVYPLKQHETEYFSVKPVKIWDYVLGKTIWNQVLLSETSGISRLCFGKMIWNWGFLSETGGKSRLCFGKMIWNREFDFEKSRFMTVLIPIFKKRISISNLNWYFFETISNRFLWISSTDFVISPMPGRDNEGVINLCLHINWYQVL